MRKLTTRLTAMLLSGMLIFGSVPGAVFAADAQEDLGQTSAASEEVLNEDASVAPASAGESYSEEASYPEEASAEEAVQYYTVTLEANGGYFENEWDDAVGEIVEQAEVIEKKIPVGGTVAAVPVFMDPDGQTMFFAGWSLERDGELVSEEGEEYVPVDNCVLFAVWQASQEGADVADTAQGADAAEESGDSEAVEETGPAQEYENSEAAEETEAGSEDIEETESAQEFEDADEAYTAQETAEDTNVDADEYTMPEADNEQDAAPGAEVIYSDEDEEETSEESSDSTVAEEETILESSDEGETVREDATTGVVDSGYCSGNSLDVYWELDEEGTLTIRGTGEIMAHGVYYGSAGTTVTNVFRNRMINTVVIEEGITSIGHSAFWDCSYLKSVTIPNSVTSIGGQAFLDCSSLTSVTIPDSVTSIGRVAFSGCSSLTSVTIPDSVTSIGEGIFSDCSSLTSVTIPDSVTSIGGSAFSGCSRLTSVTIPDSVTSIGRSAFSCCTSLESVTIPDNVTIIGEATFFHCFSLTSVTIPDSVTSIGDNAFELCTSLKNVTIPDGVTSIGNRAFYGCSSLESVMIPDSVTSIGTWAFSGCSSLTSVKIGNGVTSIGSGAFSDCRNLTSVTIPDSVTSIGGNAFNSCRSLTTVYFNGNAPSIDSDVFKGVIATAYYPANDSTWTEDKKQNFGGAITWKPWIPGQSDMGSGLILDPAFSCTVGDTFTISATYTSKTNIDITASIQTDAGGALEVGDITVSSPSAVGSNYEFSISFPVSGIKAGEYRLNLITSDGGEATTTITVYGDVYIQYPGFMSDVVLLGENSVLVDLKTNNPSIDLDEEAEKITWAFEDPSFGDVIANNYGEGWLRVTINGKRPGKTRIITTFSDGSTFSKDITFEPKMTVSVGAELDNGEIDEINTVISYSDVWCKVSLEGYGADKEYLNDFINKVTYNENDIKDKIDVIGESSYVSEDGLSAWKKLRICLKENKRSEALSILFTSPGKQEAEKALTVSKNKIAQLTYRAQGKRWNNSDGSHSFLFSDNYFYQTNTEYNNDLAVMSLGLEMSAYSSHDYDDQYTFGDSRRQKNLSNAFKKIGFKELKFFKYDAPLTDSSNYAAFGIAKKTISNKDRNDTLIAVAIRGGGYGAEWSSNFDVGDSGDSYGFRCAADWALTELKQYIIDLKDSGEITGDIKVWVVGFSRGAAVANILGHKINKGELGEDISRENNYVYTFATPSGQFGYDQSDTNIFNIVSCSDMVPRLPLKDWGFSKYGVTYSIFGFYRKEAVENSYKNYTGEEFDVENAGFLVACIEELFFVLAPRLRDYTSYAQDTFMSVFKDNYSEKETDNTLIHSFLECVGITALNALLDDSQEDIIEWKTLWAAGKFIKAIAIFYKAFDKRTTEQGIKLKDLNSFKTVIEEKDSIKSAHFPEHYLSWLESGGILTMGDDTYANLDQNERDRIELSILDVFDDECAKLINLHCPIDVTVYSSSGKVVGKIVDNTVITDNIPCYVKGDTKRIYFPAGDEYKIEITGTDYGKMDYSVMEFSDGLSICRTVEFFNVDISPDIVYETEISDDVLDPNETYAVTSGDITTVPSIDTERGIEEPYYNLTVNGGEAEYYHLMNGEGVSVQAIVPDNNTFVKWLSDDQDVYIEDPANEKTTVRIASHDTTITALFASGRQCAVKIDANGGVINSELDDSTGQEAVNAESVTKQVTIGEYVFIPARHVQNEDDSLFLFGWSLSPGGDPVITFNEGYKPDDDCTLYAVWKRGKLAGTRRYGDLNYNERLDIGDIVRIQRHIQAESDDSVRTAHPDWIITGYDYEAADINHNAVLSNTDVTLIEQSIAAQNSEETQANHPDWIITETFDFYSFDEIEPISIEEAAVTGLETKTYTGKAITQALVVKIGDTILEKDTDYSIAYSNNTNAGTATVTITGKGNYTGTKTATFKINKAAQTITAKAAASSVAVGKTTTVSLTGNKGSRSFKSSDTNIATVTSAGKVTAKKVGTVKITASAAATDNYNAASKTVTIKIVPAATASLKAANQTKGIKLTWKKVAGANGYIVYRGSKKIKNIANGSTVTFTDTGANTNGAKYVFKIIAKASTGTSTLSKSVALFRVAQPAIKTLKSSSSGKMTVAWGKNAKGNGYQIQYSSRSDFKTQKTVTVGSAKTVSKTISGLAKKHKYYVRIRAYKTGTSGKTKYYSTWSAKKTVKTK